MKRARLKATELIAMPVERESNGTRLGISARREGWLKPIAMPCTRTRSANSSTPITPLAVRKNSVPAWSRAMVCAAIMMRSRSKRSANTPPRGPMKTAGSRSAQATRPSQKPDWVKSQVSQPTAVRCIQVPISETALPEM